MHFRPREYSGENVHNVNVQDDLPGGEQDGGEAE